MEKQSTRKFLKLIVALVAFFLIGAAALMLASCKEEHVHEYTRTVTQEPTCTQTGIATFTCSCGDGTYTETIPVLGHDLGDWTVDTAATCTTDGIEVRSCSRCDYEESRIIPATDHSWDEGTVETEATCSASGLKVYKCKNCDEIKQEIIPATGKHDWVFSYKYAASCESEGYTVEKCSICGVTRQTDFTDKIDHQYAIDPESVKEATCTEAAYREYECVYCGDRYADAQYSASNGPLGHDLEGVAWEVKVAATCTTAGVDHRFCKRCGTEFEQDTPALGHLYIATNGGTTGGVSSVNAAAFNAELKKDSLYICVAQNDLVDVDGNKYAYTCARENCPCEVVIDAAGTTAHYVDVVAHDYTGEVWTTKTLATCTTDGEEHRFCTVCNYEDTRKVDAYDHAWNTVQMDGKTDVVVCEADTGLTQEVYLAKMRASLGEAKYAEMVSDLVLKYGEATKDGVGVSRFCSRCGELTSATGHTYIVSKLQDGKYGLNDYEVDPETGLPVDSGLTVAQMDCRYVQVCKNGCGKVLARGQHGKIIEATCRYGGYCDVCKEQTSAQLPHDYESVSEILKWKDSTDATQKAIYDAYIAVSAAQGNDWMTPVVGSCATNTEGTNVQLCVNCLLAAAEGEETVTWTKSSSVLTDGIRAENASVVSTGTTHQYVAHYYRLNATSTDANEIVFEQTNCEFGYKIAYKCEDCGKVLTSNPATGGAKDAEGNEIGATTAAGWVAASGSTTEAEDHIGKHSLYVIPEYQQTNGYLASTCVSKAIIPYVCEYCGTTFTLEYGATDEVRYEYAEAESVEGMGTVATADQAYNPNNHANDPFACGKHCDAYVENAEGVKLYCSSFDTTNGEGSKVPVDMSARQGELEATSHATVKVSYKFSTSVKYYDEYTLQIANVPATAITEGAAIDWTKATLSDTTKVSLCQNDSKYNMPKKYQATGNEAGDYLVLVAEDGTIYGISDFTLYTEDATTPGNAVTADTTVNQDDVFFVRLGEGNVTDAPITAVDATSLTTAFAGTPVTVGTGADAKQVLSVDLGGDITLPATATGNEKTTLNDLLNSVAEEVDEVEVNLNGGTLTQAASTQFVPTKDVTFSNGELNFSATDKGASSSLVNPEGDVTVTLDGVKMTTASGTAIYAEDKEDGYPTIVINNSTIVSAGAYGVSTNAKNTATDADIMIDITITNSTISAGSDEVAGTALFINVPSNVTVKGCTLTANYQTVIVRGGTLNMSDTVLNLVEGYEDEEVTSDSYSTVVTGSKDCAASAWQSYVTGINDLNMYRLAGIWEQGNGLARGAMVLGNSNKTSYQYETDVTISGITFNIEDETMPKIVIASCYSDATMGNATEGWNTMVTVDATGEGLSASDITYTFNTVLDTVETIGFAN